MAMSTATKIVAVAAVGVGVYLIATSASAAPKPKKKIVAEPPGDEPPVQPPGSKKRPAGHPSPYGKACYPPKWGGSNAYDQDYWGGGPAGRQQIFDAFTVLGYATPTDRDTMNDLGPDASGKVAGDEGFDAGSALGGDNDVPNPEVKRFQKNYNAVSRWKNFTSGMGGLDEDGLVGPCTLNGIRLVLDNLADGQEWQSVVAAAGNS
jgi:hypothetical protein